jgi:hypothetical protein
MAVDPHKFLAKTLGVNTPMFLFNTEFYFPLSSLLVHKSHESKLTYVVSGSSIGSVFAYGPRVWGLISQTVFFLIAMFVMGLEAVNFYLFFKSLYLFIFFLPVFTFKNKNDCDRSLIPSFAWKK